MIPWFKRSSPALGYTAAVLLAVAAQLSRIPLHPQTLIPYITYMPFILLSAFIGGLGPGVLTTGLCTLESLYFATEPLGSVSVIEAQHLIGLGALACTGVVASLLFERLTRSQRAEVVTEGRRAQLAQDLESRQHMLESIIQHSPVPIALLRGPDFVFEMVNPAYEALASGEPMAGRTVAEVWPEAVPLVGPLLKMVREAQTVYHTTGMEVPLHRAPGSAAEQRYFDFSYVPLTGPGGAAGVQILVVATEVTEHKLSEKALRAAHQELTAIHANIPVGIFVIDEELRVRKSSDLAIKLAGSDLSDKRGQCPIGAVACLDGLADSTPCGGGSSCDECPIRVAALDSLHNGARHESVEALVPVSANGKQELRWLLVSTAPMRLEGLKALICVQDITERKQLAEELARQRGRLQRQADLISFSHDAIIATNAAEVIEEWNKGAEEIYGWTEADVVGRVINDLLKTKPPEMKVEIKGCLSRDGCWDGEIRHARRDGQRIIVGSRQISLRDATGTLTGTLSVNRDITEQKKTGEDLQTTLGELEAALKEKTILLKEVHHRVKNNLAVISSLLNMSAHATEIPEAKVALDESQQRVYSIALIHEQLYGTEHLDRINFANYVRQLVKDLNVAFGAETRRISVRVDAEPIEMGVHRAVPCALILNELVANAFKHAFPGQQEGEVRISFRESAPGYLELRIQDNGVGCPSGLDWHDGKSVGWRIVDILTKQLGGSFGQEPSSGTQFVLRFPAGTSCVRPGRKSAASSD